MESNISRRKCSETELAERRERAADMKERRRLERMLMSGAKLSDEEWTRLDEIEKKHAARIAAGSNFRKFEADFKTWQRICWHVQRRRDFDEVVATVRLSPYRATTLDSTSVFKIMLDDAYSGTYRKRSLNEWAWEWMQREKRKCLAK